MRRFILENSGLKLLSLFVALMLWVYIGTGQMLERRENVQLEFADIPSGLRLAPDVRTQVAVAFSGRRDPIRQLNPDEMKAVVSLKPGSGPGQDLRIVPRIRNLPKGIMADIPSLTVRLVPSP